MQAAGHNLGLNEGERKLRKKSKQRKQISRRLCDGFGHSRRGVASNPRGVKMVQQIRNAAVAANLQAAQRQARETRTKEASEDAAEMATNIAGVVGEVIYREGGVKAPVLSTSGKSLTLGWGKLPQDVADAVATLLGLPIGTDVTLTVTCRTAVALKGLPKDKAEAILSAAKARRDAKNAKAQGAGAAEKAPDNSNAWE
jgi:hypothetical protein